MVPPDEGATVPEERTGTGKREDGCGATTLLTVEETVGAACDTVVGAGMLNARGGGPEVGKREVDGDSTLPTVEGTVGAACETVVGA